MILKVGGGKCRMGWVGNLWSFYTTFAVVRVVQGKARYDIIFVVSQALPEESKLMLLKAGLFLKKF